MPQPNTQPSLSAGQLIGGCRVVRLLGVGGMGEVYLAEHLRLEKRVAVKVLPPRWGSSDSVARFLKEARTGSRIEHPNVVTIHDVGQAGDLYYIVMQYVEGRNLAELLEAQQGPLAWRSALRLTRLAAAGVQAVHKQGLIHRDIKPSNIMLASDSRVLLMDFGLVREESESDLTHSGRVVGTPQFMSPEQCRGKALDPRSDVYSLGATLYCLLTGRAPFQGNTREVLTSIASGRRARAVHDVVPSVPKPVSELVAKAMSLRPADRFADAASMGREIGRLLKQDMIVEASFATDGSSVSLERTQTVPELELIPDVEFDEQPEFARQQAWRIAAGVAIFLLLAIVGLLLNWAPRGEGPKPDENRMILIEAGFARLGTDPDQVTAHLRSLPAMQNNNELLESAQEFLAEEPVGRVFVPAFRIDPYEVTNAEYAEFLRSTGRAPPRGWSNDKPPAGREDHPVVHVDFPEAEAYAAWAGKQLPTRAQWLRAYRGDDNRLFPWGNDYDPTRANSYENKQINPAASTPVTATPRDVSPFGVYNLVGNVSEYVRERTFRDGVEVVFTKGADFKNGASVYGVASAQRTYELDSRTANNAGFRCVVELP